MYTHLVFKILQNVWNRIWQKTNTIPLNTLRQQISHYFRKINNFYVHL